MKRKIKERIMPAKRKDVSIKVISVSRYSVVVTITHYGQKPIAKTLCVGDEIIVNKCRIADGEEK